MFLFCFFGTIHKGIAIWYGLNSAYTNHATKKSEKTKSERNGEEKITRTNDKLPHKFRLRLVTFHINEYTRRSHVRSFHCVCVWTNDIWDFSVRTFLRLYLLRIVIWFQCIFDLNRPTAINCCCCCRCFGQQIRSNARLNFEHNLPNLIIITFGVCFFSPSRSQCLLFSMSLYLVIPLWLGITCFAIEFNNTLRCCCLLTTCRSRLPRPSRMAW